MRGRWRGERMRIPVWSCLRRWPGAGLPMGMAGRASTGRQAQPGIESMTAARRQPGVLMRRCRGARSVASSTAPVAQWIEQRSSSAPHAGSSPAGGANFNAAEAGSSPAVERIVCRHRKPLRQMTHEAPVRRQLITSAERASRSSARPAALFNGRNAQVDAPATAVPVLCSRHTREIDTGLKHETSPAHSPRCAKGWQDIRAGSAHSEDRA